MILNRLRAIMPQRSAFYYLTMNDLLKNPFFVFLAGLITLWLVFKALKVFVSLFGLFVLAFVILFVVNARFRSIVQGFFRTIFRNDN